MRAGKKTTTSQRRKMPPCPPGRRTGLTRMRRHPRRSAHACRDSRKASPWPRLGRSGGSGSGTAPSLPIAVRINNAVAGVRGLWVCRSGVSGFLRQDVRIDRGGYNGATFGARGLDTIPCATPSLAPDHSTASRVPCCGFSASFHGNPSFYSRAIPDGAPSRGVRDFNHLLILLGVVRVGRTRSTDPRPVAYRHPGGALIVTAPGGLPCLHVGTCVDNDRRCRALPSCPNHVCSGVIGHCHSGLPPTQRQTRPKKRSRRRMERQPLGRPTTRAIG